MEGAARRGLNREDERPETGAVPHGPDGESPSPAILPIPETRVRWGGPEFRSCHGAAGDSDGNIYFVQPEEGQSGRRIVKYVRQ